MAEGYGKTVKYALIVANLLIISGGIAVFAVGVWTLADKSFMESLLGSKLFVSSAAIMVCTGLMTTFIALLGFFGAWREVRFLLMIYFVVLLVTFVIMMVGGALAYAFRNDVDERMYAEMMKSISKYKNDSLITQSWDTVQQVFKCCGMQVRTTAGMMESPTRIWLQNANFNWMKQVPDSCCMRKEWLNGCRERPTERDTYFTNCYLKMREFLKDHAQIIGAVGIAIAFVLVIGMILSCSLILMLR